MSSPPEIVPDDVATLKAALLAERSARLEAEARDSGAEAMVAHLKLLLQDRLDRRTKSAGGCLMVRGAEQPAAGPVARSNTMTEN